MALAIISVTAPTEADRISKALIWLFVGSGKAHQLICETISTEIEKSKRSPTNVLFRGDSVATKLFQNYSRIIALDYLWNTLANFLVQLDNESQKMEEEEGGYSISYEVQQLKGILFDVLGRPGEIVRRSA